MKAIKITGTVALAILFSILNTACGYDVRLTEEDDIEQGYSFHTAISVNTSLQTTRAAYNLETMRLTFSAGDQLFICGTHAQAGDFAGLLIWSSGNSFSGTITTSNEYRGTATNILNEALSAEATLLPNGYTGYGYLTMSGQGCSTVLDSPVIAKAFADSKAHGVEQLSYVHAKTWANGFTLTPGNAVFSCTVQGLAANTPYTFTATDGSSSPSGTVITNDMGEAVFAVAFAPDGCKNYSIRIDDGSAYQDISIGTRTLIVGHIYNSRNTAKSMQ